MRLLSSNPWRGYGISRVLGVFFYSTRTLARRSPPIDSLYSRVSRAGDPKVSIIRVIDQWLEEGRQVQQSDILMMIKQLRKFRRYSQALQIFEWVSDQRHHDLSPGEIAIRLDLISKVHGLEEAEKYFDSIPNTLRVYQVYGALLNCYAENKSLDKAEATMQKMRELGFLKTSLSFNVMLNLYSRMGKTEKLHVLTKEMEEMGIDWDMFTFNIRLNAYVAMSDIKEMERLLTKMEADPLITIDWNSYVVAANGYLKAGLHEKTLEMLQKAEQHVSNKTRKSAYEIFLTQYTAIQNKDGLYHIWNLYKNMGRFYNSGYLCMISSLLKLDDIDGAEKILEEWESENTFFDSRIPHLLISAYCRKGLLEKAEAYMNRLIECGKETESTKWGRLATGYHVHGQMEKAVETMKKAILASQPGWMPNRFTLAACLDYLKGNGEVEVAEEILRLLREHVHFSTGVYERLLNYIHSENKDSRAFDHMKADVRTEGDDQDQEGEIQGGNGSQA